MKACIIQPPYSVDYSLSEKMFQWELDSLEQCDESMDLIVLPESSDVPCLATLNEDFKASYERNNKPLLEKAAETARRCQAVVFVNAYYQTDNVLRNTTHAFDKDGNVVGRYFKQHLTPESSMAALGAAVAMGADEIEFDIWPTKDGELVVVHDRKLERLSNGQGYVADHTYEELLELDFGSHFSPEFAGLRIITFEEVLKKFACHVVMNIHVKWHDNKSPYDQAMLEKMIGLIRKYDCEKYVYLMSGNDTFLKQVQAYAPDICLCVGGGDAFEAIVDRAIEMNCPKVQLVKGHFTQEMIDKAHEHGIICNVFWSDDEEETKEFLKMGIDTILTNDYHRISKVVKDSLEGES